MEQIPLLALQESGLTRNESKVYYALLVLGTSNAAQIIKKSQVHRINVYEILKRLQEKGLISCIVKNKHKVYEAANPQRLLELVKEKEYMIDKAMPHLQQVFEEKKQASQVYFFRGVQGIMQAYDMMLAQKKTIYALGGSGMTRRYLRHRHDSWNERRKKLGIKGKVLYYAFTKEDRTNKSWKDPTMEVRYIPDAYKGKVIVDICGSLVINLHPVEDTIMAIVIENALIAESYRQFFSFMWEHAQP